MVPGHEIVGRVTAVGAHVKKFKVGDLAGVGCLVDSCRTCPQCAADDEQFCEGGMVGTYNSLDKQGQPTYGGYSKSIVVDENYTLRIPENLDLGVAPLLCAGITTYSPSSALESGQGYKGGGDRFGRTGPYGSQTGCHDGASNGDQYVG